MKPFAFALFAAMTLFAAVPETDKGKSYGGPNAPIQMEAFTDFSCSHCKHFHEAIVPLLMRDYVVSGKVYFVNRDFPLTGPGHQYCPLAHAAADAAARIGKYQPVADALWDKQEQWSVNGKVWDVVNAVLTPAEQKKVEALANDPGVKAEVAREFQEGESYGVNGTPAVFITHNGRRIPIPQPDNYPLLKSLLDSMLK